MNIRSRSRISSSPVLVGAITTVIVIVGVFLAYNANSGLPFVPTYSVTAELPNAGSLVKNNEVRIAGVRVGQVSSVTAEQLPNGRSVAKVDMKLDQSVKPIPEDSTVVVRSQSAIGLKYLLLVPGRSSEGVPAGGSLPLRAARPKPVEMDQFFNMFQKPVRGAIQQNLTRVGGILAGRGPAINLLLGELPSLLRRLQPVSRNLASRKTDLKGFIHGLSQSAAEVAPVAQQQADMFEALDTTFSALAVVARPYIQESISEGVPTQRVTQEALPHVRPFLTASTRFLKAFQPGARALAESAPIVNRSLVVGTPVLNASPKFNEQLGPTARSLRRFAEDPNVTAGLDSLTDTNQILRPLLSFVTPAQTVCNYLSLLLRNGQEISSTGNSTGGWTRAVAVFPPVGPNGEGVPASAPANGGGSTPDKAFVNFLHFNPYPNTAAPGQDPQECEAGNEPYEGGRQVIGNVPGDQGTVTEDQLFEGTNLGK